MHRKCSVLISRGPSVQTWTVWLAFKVAVVTVSLHSLFILGLFTFAPLSLSTGFDFHSLKRTSELITHPYALLFHCCCRQTSNITLSFHSSCWHTAIHCNCFSMSVFCSDTSSKTPSSEPCRSTVVVSHIVKVHLWVYCFINLLHYLHFPLFYHLQSCSSLPMLPSQIT